jgi:hypothetical protein
VLSVWKPTAALPRIRDETFALLEEANILVLVDNDGIEPQKRNGLDCSMDDVN